MLVVQDAKLSLTPATFDIAGETARRRIENDKWATPATLRPAEAFNDEPASEAVFRRLCAPETPRGRHACTDGRIISSLRWMGATPDRRRVCDAVRASRPTHPQEVVIRTWGAEATREDLVEARAQQAYTFREFVHALHGTEFSYGSPIRTINGWARKF